MAFNLLCKLIGHKYPQYDQAVRHGCKCKRCGDVPLTFVRTSEVLERSNKVAPPPAYTRSAQSFSQGGQ